MEIIFEFLFWMIFEFALQIVGELILEAMSRPANKLLRSKPSGLFLTIAYLSFGALAGYISVLLLPVGLIETPEIRIAYLMFSPVLLASALFLLRHMMDLSPTISDGLYFWITYLFALAFSAVRYVMVY